MLSLFFVSFHLKTKNNNNNKQILMSAQAALVSMAEPALTLLTEFVANARQNGRVIYATSVSKMV